VPAGSSCKTGFDRVTRDARGNATQCHRDSFFSVPIPYSGPASIEACCVGRSREVRIDPWDARYCYALLDRDWQRCSCRLVSRAQHQAGSSLGTPGDRRPQRLVDRFYPSGKFRLLFRAGLRTACIERGCSDPPPKRIRSPGARLDRRSFVARLYLRGSAKVVYSRSRKYGHGGSRDCGSLMGHCPRSTLLAAI
jgi:hypothetical protein